MIYNQQLIQNHFAGLFKSKSYFASESQIAAPVLFTDDEPAILELYRHIAEHEGIPAICTAHTQEALLICRQEPISLVISDIVHPVMSGFELLVALRDDPRTEYLPVMFVSASNNYYERAQLGYPLDADAYLDKPFDQRKLVRKIRSLCLKISAYQVA